MCGKEESAPIGYMIDKKVYTIELKYKDQNTEIIFGTADSTDKVKEMRIHIFKSGMKVNSGKVNGLQGARFAIKLNSAVQRALEEGYTYEEIWDGVDEYGNQVEVNASRVAQAQVIAPTYEVLETDENGDAYTTNPLPYGTFVGKEIYTPKDYESAEDFLFSITQDESEIEDIAKKVKDIFINNEQLETYIKLVKKDLKTEKIVTLNNATFQVKATKDIYDRSTGKILYKKGEIITQKIGSTIYNSFTTNADNIVVPEESYLSKNDDKGTTITPLKLEVGSYAIYELSIPTGFLQLDNPIEFKVEGVRNYDTDSEGDYIKEIVVKNEQPTGTLTINKTIALREDVDTSLVDTSDLSDIKFRLTAKEDIIDMADGSKIYEKGQVVGEYNLTKEGTLEVNSIPMGKYELKEIETLKTLILNDTIYDVEFTKQDDTTKVYEVEKDISNDTTLLEISKQDITGEKELIGAKLQVIDEDDNVIDEWISTEKTHKIEGVEIGKQYKLLEITAPEPFVKATEIEFTINETGVDKVTMIDKVVEMSKVDIAGEEIEGATIQVFDEDNNLIDEWISTKEPHKISGLEENKTYRLHEELAIDNFVKATDIEFKVTEDKETQHLTMIDKVVEMSKVDIAGEEIEGATIQVFDEDDNLIDEWISTKEPHKISGLEENKTYRLHEELVVDNFVKATDIEFKVTEDKETQHLTMIDKIVEVVKTDFVTGEEVEGAELKVVDEEDNIIDEWISTKEPHKVKGLEESKKYRLIEITSPYGFEIAEEIEFVVTEDKETQRIEMKDMPILTDVKLIKIDSETKEKIQDDFVFGIYEDPECTELIQEINSNKEEASILFDDLRYNTFYIKELSSPKDYVLSDKVVKLEINDKGVFADDIELTNEDGVYSFEFENQKMETPKTRR